MSNYDAHQMLKHTFGIYNYVDKNKDSSNEIELINAIWDFKDLSDLSEISKTKYKEKKE